MRASRIVAGWTAAAGRLHLSTPTGGSRCRTVAVGRPPVSTSTRAQRGAAWWGWPRALSGGLHDSILEAEVADGVATLTLMDNKKRNALSSRMMVALRDTIKGYEHDKAVKVVVIRHDGKVFSSGHDLKEINLQQTTTGTTEPVFSLCSSLMLAIQQARFPVIAEVGGLATAGGCQLVAACKSCMWVWLCGWCAFLASW